MGRNEMGFAFAKAGTYDQTQRTRGREGGRRVRRRDHANGEHEQQTYRSEERNLHMPRGMGEPVPLQQLSVSLDQTSTQ